MGIETSFFNWIKIPYSIFFCTICKTPFLQTVMRLQVMYNGMPALFLLLTYRAKESLLLQFKTTTKQIY